MARKNYSEKFVAERRRNRRESFRRLWTHHDPAWIPPHVASVRTGARCCRTATHAPGSSGPRIVPAPNRASRTWWRCLLDLPTREAEARVWSPCGTRPGKVARGGQSVRRTERTRTSAHMPVAEAARAVLDVALDRGRVTSQRLEGSPSRAPTRDGVATGCRRRSRACSTPSSSPSRRSPDQ
jgi:hypothetical protein